MFASTLEHIPTGAAALVMSCLVLAGCAKTQVGAQWVDRAFKGQSRGAAQGSGREVKALRSAGAQRPVRDCEAAALALKSSNTVQ